MHNILQKSDTFAVSLKKKKKKEKEQHLAIYTNLTLTRSYSTVDVFGRLNLPKVYEEMRCDSQKYTQYSKQSTRCDIL